MEGKVSLILLQLGILLGLTTALPHSTPYSLQAAVDALHRRETQLSSASGNHDSNFEDNEGANHRALNHFLSSYLAHDTGDQRFNDDEREEYLPEFDDRDQFFDDEEYGPDDKKRKRSMFREREEREPSVFREREYGHPSTLDEDFLREMDRERNIDRDRKYHALIKQLWGKYKHDDEELERQLLRNELEHTREMQDDDNYPDMSEEDSDDFYKKKRSMKKKRMMFAPMFGYPSAITAGYYGGPGAPMAYQKKKRGYPVLPWLPASRKKRFPVAKRSPRPNEFRDMTDEKVARDLKEIFGSDDDDDKKKKRSSDLFGMDKKRMDESEEDKKKRMVKKSEELEEDKKKKSVKKSVEEDEDKKKRTVKKSEMNDDDLDDKKKKREKKDEIGDEEDEDDKKKKRAKKDRFIDDSMDEDKKKKRSVKRKRNSDDDCEDDDCKPHDHYTDSEEDEFDESDEDVQDDADDDDDEGDDEDRRRRKKKRDVKKRKRSNMEILREEQIIPGDLIDMKKRDMNWSRTWGMDRRKKSSGSSSHDYPLSFYKNYDEDRHRNSDLSKINNMDHKLKTIEDLLIDETIKYTGAHEGIVEPEDIKELKDHVVSRLATAYNLEKMRHALDKIKNNMEEEQHLEGNEIPDDSDEKKAKRVAVKKEKVEFDHSGHKPEDAPKKVEHEEPENDMDDDDDKKKKKKKKRNGIEDLLEENGVELPPQCTILENLDKRCKGVDALSGDLHQDLLPACGVHQLCYLCGTSQSECDFQYLADAETICGHHSGCQSAARSALMILRGFPSPTLGPRECAKNPCLYQALKDIGV